MIKRFFVGLAAATMAIAASAQTSPMQTNLKQGMYKGKLGISNVKNPSDAQLREVGKRISAIPMPTKAEAAKMVKAAMAQHSYAKSKGAANGIVERISTAKYEDSDYLFRESWEAWDGTFNWRPSTWNHFCNFDQSIYISEADGNCPTWMAYETDGYYSPYATDGNFVMLCMFGEEILGSDGKTVIAPAPEQDEWIVSAPINNVQASNYLVFDLAYSPIYTHAFTELVGDQYQMNVDMSRIAYDVEVLITTSTRSASNNEANYKKVFKLSDIVDEYLKDIDVEDPNNQAALLNMAWKHFRIPLSEYAGSNIRIAFRYKGSKGGAVLLDAVRVSDMLPVALYDRPEGSFYFGFSDDARLSYSKNVLMPAYTKSVWTNYSNDDAETFNWTYNINGESGTSNSVDLTMPGVKPGSINWPTLQANAGLRADQYNGGLDVVVNNAVQHSDFGVAKVGGDARLSYSNGMVVNFGLGNFDPTKLYWLGEVSATGGAYAFGTGSGPFWGQMTEYKYNAVSGIANVYDAPASPYVFNSVMMPLGDLFNVGANIVCTVYKANDLGNGALEVTDEVLGQATATDGVSAGGGYIMTFNFPNVMVIDSPIAIEVSGFDNANLISLAPLTQALNHDSGKGYGFVLLKNQSSGDVWWCEIAGALSAVEGSGNMEVSHCLGLNAVFPYLHSNDGDVFEALTVGETKTFDIDSYSHPEKQDASDVVNGWTIECSEPWISANVSIDNAAQKAGVNITVEAMPSAVTGRVGKVTIKALGCEEVITVTQGEVSGIAGVTVDGFSTSAGTYNLAGQRMNSNSTKSGLYIVNRGGKFVKVLK